MNPTPVDAATWPGIARARQRAAAAARRLREVADCIVTTAGACLAASGGYAKGLMTDGSDVDLFVLFPVHSPETERVHHLLTAALTRAEMPFEFYPFGEIEKWQSLVTDHVILAAEAVYATYVCGDRDLFDAFRAAVLPCAFDQRQIDRYFLWNIVYRERQRLVLEDPEHPKYGLGGLRDMMLLQAVAKRILRCRSNDAVALLDCLAEHAVVNAGEHALLVRGLDTILLLLENRCDSALATERRKQAIAIDTIATQVRGRLAEHILHRLGPRAASLASAMLRETPERAQAEAVLSLAKSSPLPAAELLLFLLAWSCEDTEVLRGVHALGTSSWIIRAALVANRQTDPKILAALGASLREGDDDIRLFAARNRSTPPATLRFIAGNAGFRPVERESARLTLEEVA